MRNMVWILLTLCCASLGLAQHPNCTDVQIFESKLPIYPPIARAAHLHGIFHFAVDVYPDGHSDVRFLDGPRSVSGIAFAEVNSGICRAGVRTGARSQ